MKITKDTLIADIIAQDSAAAECFFQVGMFCIGCPASNGESLEEACMAHGINVEILLESLNSFFSNEN